jgi:tetratricopeptide (TPR) repeat protein
MTSILKAVKDLLDQAASGRKKGDALRKVGRENAAKRAYEAALVHAEAAIKHLQQSPFDALYCAEPQLSAEHQEILLDLVEAFGVQGGLLQRLMRIPEALASYSEGGELERQFHLPGTYNRMNVLKYMLLSGEKPLSSLQQQIQEIAEGIEEQLRRDPQLADSGWAWADLGDARALLGQLDQAQKAYATFIDKSETKSPERAVEVLTQIVSKLQQSGDPDAERLVTAIDFLKARLQKG